MVPTVLPLPSPRSLEGGNRAASGERGCERQHSRAPRSQRSPSAWSAYMRSACMRSMRPIHPALPLAAALRASRVLLKSRIQIKSALSKTLVLYYTTSSILAS